MMSKRFAVLAVLIVACVALATTAQTQVTVTTEVRQATVVHVGDNFIVVKSAKDGRSRGFNIPPGFTFTMGDKQVPLSELKPGDVVTATITTASAPVIEKTEEVKEATVVRVIGQNVFLQLPDGKYKRYEVPKDFLFDYNGKKLPVSQLSPGMKVTQTIVSEKQVATVTAADIQASVSQPTPAAAPAPAAPPAPQPPPAPATKLPKTAGPLPLVGLLGLLSLGLGAGLSALRRREES
jgi:hypothetical protein